MGDRDAWNAQSGLPKTEAKRRYIATLIEVCGPFFLFSELKRPRADSIFRRCINTRQGHSELLVLPPPLHSSFALIPRRQARELVAELEFVWDQIRSNQSSLAAATSPPESGGSVHQAPLMPAPYTGELGVVSPNPFGEEEFEEDISGMDTDHRSNRKWRKRVEQALAKMATEVTALRERMDDERASKRRGRFREAGHWFLWVVWVGGRHMIIELVFWGCVFMWMRRRGDTRAQEALRLVAKFVKDRLGFFGFGFGSKKRTMKQIR